MQTQTLSYRFADSMQTHTLQGTQKELIAFLDDFNWFSSKALINACAYLKPRALGSVCVKPLVPIDPIIQHMFAPIVEEPAIKVQPIERKEPVKVKHVVTSVAASVRSIRNRDHERAYIHLADDTTCTCTETGISFKVTLAAPLRLNLEVLHPLAFNNNVESLILSYRKSGIHLEKELERQVLAGMLITTLRHKGLLACTDYPAANLCLQRAKGETLSHVLRFIAGSKSTKGMPSLRLIPEAIYDTAYIPMGMTQAACIDDRVEIMLQNYVKLCKGEGEGETRHTSIWQKPKDTGKVRIYGGNLSIESRQADAAAKHADILLDKLNNEIHITQTVKDHIERQIDAFAFLGTDKREKIAREIIHMFPTSKTAKELAALFARTKTETIELGLESFTQSLESELGEFKEVKRKFNLLSKVLK